MTCDKSILLTIRSAQSYITFVANTISVLMKFIIVNPHLLKRTLCTSPMPVDAHGLSATEIKNYFTNFLQKILENPLFQSQ